MDRRLGAAGQIRGYGTKVVDHGGIIHHGRLDKGVQKAVKPFSFNELAAKVLDVLDASKE